MIKLTWGQWTVLAVTSVPMAAVGVAGAVATYVNMDNVLHRGASALGLVAAGEGATLICALIALAVTLMGQHTPTAVRLGMWLIPLVASGTGIALAPNNTERVVMGITPLAMTAAGEGVAFVARRVVAYRTGTDIEQQRRSGLLLWHANRAANGKGLGKWMSNKAVWRLTKEFAATDGQLSVQLGELQRYRIAEGADQNLAAVLTKDAVRPSLNLADESPALPPAYADESDYGPLTASVPLKPNQVEVDGDVYDMLPVPHITESLAEFKGSPVPFEVIDLDDEEESTEDYMARMFAEANERDTETAPVVQLMTSDDVAVHHNVKPATVRSWVARGKLRVHDKDTQGRSLFHPDDVAQVKHP